MGTVLDTSALVDLERKEIDLASSLPKGDEDVYLPAIVLAELWIGIRLSENEKMRKNRLAKVRSLQEATISMPFTEEVAPTYASLHADLRKKGKQIPSNDLAVAAMAIHFGYRVLIGTSDEAHFRVVPGLEVLVLRA